MARLSEWGRWRLTSANKGGPNRCKSWWFPVVMKGRVKQLRDWDRPGFDEKRCLETEQCVQALPDDLRETVFQHYVAGGTMRQQTQALGLASPQTIYNRLEKANPMLIGMMNDVAAGLDPKP